MAKLSTATHAHFGKRVRFKRVLFRRTKAKHGRANMRKWVRTEWTGKGEGMIVGVRTVYNGTVLYGGWEDGNCFEQKDSIPHYLVAENAGSFVRVHPEDIDILGERFKVGDRVTVRASGFDYFGQSGTVMDVASEGFSENRFYRVKMDSSGFMVGFYDDELERED